MKTLLVALAVTVVLTAAGAVSARPLHHHHR